MEFVGAVALIIAAGGAIGAVCSLGGAVSDRLDVFSHFTPIYLLAGAAGLLLGLIDRTAGAWPTLGLAASAMLISAGLMAPDLIAKATRRPAPDGGPEVKLIQFNIWKLNRDPAATAGWIARENADVVVLEEVGGAGARVAQALATLYPHYAGAAQPGRSSTLILAKTPFEASGVLHAPARGAPVSAAWAKIGCGPRAFVVVASHYPWPIPAGPLQAQSRAIAAGVAPFDHDSLIIAGDFNCTPWSFSMRAQDARLGLRRLTLALFTWPAAPFLHRTISSPLPFLPLDHVYAGKAWAPVSVRRGPRLGSDHFPVVVVLRRVD